MRLRTARRVHRRYLLYSTIGNHQVHMASSQDLESWQPLGICAELPQRYRSHERTAAGNLVPCERVNNSESLTVMPIR